MKTLWKELHLEACKQGQDFYVDPDSGYLVATELRLKKVGQCCKCNCRHCPYKTRVEIVSSASTVDLLSAETI